ncbi:MAG: ATP-binding cassette domain-containing protein [Clostridiales bacterium]|nr:ATP-binding cassette domain-containing protein [Clostridiales bacterium]
MNVLEIEQLRKNLPQLKLDIATMEVAEGEFAVLLGAAKSGKASLFKLILDMLFPDFGVIRVFGLDSHKDSVEIKQQLGMIARRPGLLYHASLRQLKNMVRPFYRAWQEEVYRNCLQLFDINENQIYGRVGNAQKKQFVLALALAHRPRLLLLDEPFMNMPNKAKERIAQVLWREQRERGLSLLLATSSPEEAARLADTLHIVHLGSLLLTLPLAHLSDYCGDLEWQALNKRSQDEKTAEKIAQTQALFDYYTKTGEGKA